MTAISLPGARRAIPTLSRGALALGLFALASILFVLFAGETVQPRSETHPFFTVINDLRDWIRDNRDNPVYVVLFVGPRTVVDVLLTALTDGLEAIGWPALIAIMGTIGLVTGGRRLAVFAIVGMAALGVLGLWSSSVDTLGAIVAAVTLAFGLGVPLGILMAQSRIAQAVITPILDVMQIFPTFAYLLPMVLLFGIGPATAAIITLIYAMPAAIRITALGIRNVPVSTVEAGTSLGATGRQLLAKVRLPLASRELGLALNQTLMLAMSMIVITAVINAPGLGRDTLAALIRNDVGKMFDAGVAIVILAIVLDRLSERLSARLDPHRRAAAAGAVPSRRLVRAALAGTAALVVLGLVAPVARDFPDAVQFSLREPTNAVVDWLRSDVAWLTGAIKDGVSFTILNPIQTIFTTTPVWLAVGVAGGIAWLASGRRQAIVAAVSLALVYAIGLWEDAMVTLVQVLAATLITFAIGLVLGIASARSDRFAAILRPGLDVAQTMPSFVYLLPAFVLFDATRFTAIFAAVIFALPPVIRLVDVGIRSVPATIIEAATSSGSTDRQLLTKVQLPVARGALQLAANQAVILVLSMVVVGGLVGGGGLGYDVVAGYSQPRLFGMGVAAGIALVLLGIMLDRMTHGTGRRTSATGH
ncbi:MAG: ABC transporter permease [Candidatus Limnocylindria bacterium]